MSELAAAERAELARAIELERLAALPELARVAEALEARREARVGGLWGSAQSVLLAALARGARRPWLVIASTDAEARVAADDLESLGLAPAWLPSREGDGRSGDLDHLRLRLELAQAIGHPRPGVQRPIVASLLALVQPIPEPQELAADLLSVAVGERLDVQHLMSRLTAAGYARQPLVEQPGEFSLRGDILDLFPLASELPVRIELFDDEIESLRTFDPASQRSVERADALELLLSGDTGEPEEGRGVEPFRLLPPSAVFARLEPLRIEDVAQSLAVRSPAHGRALRALEEALRAHPHLSLQSLPEGALDLDTRSVQALSVGMREAPAALREAAGEDARVLVLCQNEAERHRFLDAVGDVPRMEAVVGPLAQGFRFPAAKLVVVNHRELVGIAGRRRARAERPTHHARAIQSFFELKAGDHVVHAVHGLARYEGLVRMSRGEGEEDHLHLVFADDVSVYVPAARIDVVQRYIGSGAALPQLDKVGGQSFRKRKEKVQRALYDLAADLLEVHARRALKKRTAWPWDEEMVRDLLDAFPYTDTVDQARTDEEVRGDLAGEHPMDRLICGDVGFGKTELAVRAAFRVVSGGAQVAVLVPTTILAQQHHETFRERLADFPVRVEMLSRYVPPARARETVEAAAQGQVDVLIGTHRILSKDVAFARLGLVIVDEEQRFGVTHKEHFKKLRAQVDLLTLTATPIPRTLHMSLSGVRDISALTVAPEGRQEIETHLGYLEDEGEIREAILREKARGGQVFYLHNRVRTIEQVARGLVQLVPECSFAVGHGQMSARELQGVMDLFTRGEIDVLVATTIIESGLDIPSAGTIIVHDADQFGLSELHQLRGRVGRGDAKGHCLLLIERKKPIRQVARDRLKALEEMNQLGAGFAISMKDLEIRGAGNILGPEQSGHIAAVGYDLYCRLLKATIERLQSGETIEELAREELLDPGVELELGVRAWIPAEWVPDADKRLELLRELSTISSDADEREARRGLEDRFGQVPEEAANLLRSFRIRAALEELRIRRMAFRGDTYLIEFDDRVALERWLAPLGAELRPIRTGVAHLVIPPRHAGPEPALVWLEALLRGEPVKSPRAGRPARRRRAR